MTVLTRRENSPMSDIPPRGFGIFLITRRHLAVACVWALLIALALLGATEGIAFGLAALGTVVAFVIGIHCYRPARSSPWWMALSAFALFAVGGVARERPAHAR